MAESVYKVIELVGTSTSSFEKAAAAAVNLAARSLRDLRVAEVTDLDLHIVDGKIAAYRAKVKISFKYDAGDEKSLPSEIPSAAPKRAAKKAPPPADEPEPAAPAKKAARKAKRKPKG